MSTDPPDGPEKADRRGTPPGDPDKPHGHKRDGTEFEGRRGNLPFVPTDEQRRKVRTLAKTMKHEQPQARKWIALQMGFSVDTLDRHFEDDMKAGRAEVVASMGSTLIGVALGTITDITRERLEAIKFALPRLGGWTQSVEVSGPAGGPIEHVDLSRLNAKQLDEYGRLAAIAEGLDPEEVVGPRSVN